MKKVCEECGSDNYCKHCSTCHDCLGEQMENQNQQLAAAKEEIAEYRKLLNVIATIGDKGMAKSINALLAKHKGE